MECVPVDSACVDLNGMGLLVHVWCLKIHVWHPTNKCVMAMANVYVARVPVKVFTWDQLVRIIPTIINHVWNSNLKTVIFFPSLNQLMFLV